MSAAPHLLARASPRAVLFRRGRPSFLKLAVVLWLIATIIIPIGALVLGSLRPTGAGLFSAELTLSNYSALFASPGFRFGLLNTIIASAGGTVVAVLLGTWLAFLI